MAMTLVEFLYIRNTNREKKKNYMILSFTLNLGIQRYKNILSIITVFKI